MSLEDDWKRNAAEKATEIVEDWMKVGLGSGSTLGEVIKVLGKIGSEAEFVASSAATQQLTEKMGLNLVSLERGSELDIVIDGADEVDPYFAMIKGGGGAHTREKIVASAGENINIVVDRTKLVSRLGEKNPVPVEVVPFAIDYIEGLLEEFGENIRMRKSSSGGPYITDNGNYIIDVEIPKIEGPRVLEKRLNRVPGVVENGIFADFADRIFVGYEGGCEKISSREDFEEFLNRISS